MYVLDTNVVSELRPGKPHQSPEVRAWAAAIPSSQFFISAITLLESEIGIQLLEHKTPPEGGALRNWFDALVQNFAGRILPFDAAAAKRCASLHVPNKKQFRDSMIAATALEHGFTVVTRNIVDFQLPGVKVINPWEHTP